MTSPQVVDRSRSGLIQPGALMVNPSLADDEPCQTECPLFSWASCRQAPVVAPNRAIGPASHHSRPGPFRVPMTSRRGPGVSRPLGHSHTPGLTGNGPSPPALGSPLLPRRYCWPWHRPPPTSQTGATAPYSCDGQPKHWPVYSNIARGGLGPPEARGERPAVARLDARQPDCNMTSAPARPQVTDHAVPPFGGRL